MMAAREPRWHLRRATIEDADDVTALQRSAYARNRTLLGVEPLPLQADYREIVSRDEVWLAFDGVALAGALVLAPQGDALLIWSIATAPRSEGLGLGTLLMDVAHRRAGELGLDSLRLYTGAKLTDNIAWYERLGFRIDRVETRADREIVHMSKTVA
jgi:ribosomal protein S18 acetylase RimI-like enzyme